jgi:hypothetical protein
VTKVWAIMPIPRHRLIVALLATCLCINQFSLVLSQDLRPFESETSSPSHPQSRAGSTGNEENLVITSPGGEVDTKNVPNADQGTDSSEEYADNDEESDNEYDSESDGEEGDGGESDDSEDEEDNNEEQENSENGGEEAQATAVSPQYVLPDGNSTRGDFAYPDTNVSASSIIYRTADLDTAATG